VSVPRVDLVIFVGEDVNIDLEVIDAASTVDAVGRPVPPDQWVPLDVSTGYAFRYDLRREPTSPDPPLIGLDCTIVGVHNANRAVNTQRVRAPLTDDDVNGTGAANLGANGGLYWHSHKRTNSGAERIASYGQTRAVRATQV